MRNVENKKGNAELKGINGQQYCEQGKPEGTEELKGVPKVDTASQNDI